MAPADVAYPKPELVIIHDGFVKTAEGKLVKAFSGFSRQAEMKLDQLEAATTIRDLAVLPGNRLEALKGDRKGQHSIRIND